MTGRIAFRFIHAGDFQLGQVPYGLPDLPDGIREQLLDAPFTAAERVFDAAVKHQADFVLLVGELVSNVSGNLPSPQATTFLAEQFERLNHEGIGVYLAADSSWPDWCGLPPNVHQVNDTQGIVASTRGRQPAARISRQAEFQHTNDRGMGFDILVTGRNQSLGRNPNDIDYVAGVGNEAAGQVSSDGVNSDPRIWSSGTPQGQHINSGSQHGCLVVDVNEANTADVRFVNTAPIGWAVEHVPVSGSDDVGTVVARMKSRITQLALDSGHDCILVDWILDFDGSVNGHLICDSGFQQLLEQVQRFNQFGETQICSIDVRANDTGQILVNAEPDCALLNDFIQLAGQAVRIDAGRMELQRVPGLASDTLTATQTTESRIVSHGFDLLG